MEQALQGVGEAASIIRTAGRTRTRAGSAAIGFSAAAGKPSEQAAEAILLEHNRILQALPDAIREKIGFKGAEKPGPAG